MKLKKKDIAKWLFLLLGEFFTIYGMHLIFFGSIQDTFPDVTISSMVKGISKIFAIPFSKINHGLDDVAVFGLILFCLGTIILFCDRWRIWIHEFDRLNKRLGLLYAVGFIIVRKRFSLPVLKPFLEILIITVCFYVFFDSMRKHFMEDHVNTDFENRLDISISLVWTIDAVVYGHLIAHMLVLWLMWGWGSDESIYPYAGIWASDDRFFPFALGYVISIILLLPHDLSEAGPAKAITWLPRFVLHLFIMPYIVVNQFMINIPILVKKEPYVPMPKSYDRLATAVSVLALILFYLAVFLINRGII